MPENSEHKVPLVVLTYMDGMDERCNKTEIM